MLTLFLVGTFWFWALITVVAIMLFVFTEKGFTYWSTFTTLATLLLLQFYGNIKFFSWAYTHPKELILFLLAYLAVGVVYSIMKWSLFINKRAREEYSTTLRVKLDVPKVEYHAGRIIGWMEFWPISLVWTLINDPIRAFFEFIFLKTKGLFQSIANSAYAREQAKEK
jgi:hypothetical protein